AIEFENKDSCRFNLLLFLNSTANFAGDGDIRVNQIAPKLMNHYLTVSADFQNLFSNKIIGTIQSGLPSIVQIEIKLIAAGHKQVTRKQMVRSISYNLWEERYAIKSADTTAIYADFAEVQKMSNYLENVALIKSNLLNENTEYFIQIRVEIVPISTRQGEKVTDWLLDPNQTEEDLASDERSSGFKLNLSKLVSFFVGGKKHSRYSSDWFSSKIFQIKDLK
ncbi:MAG: DUF4390 domain-containing protein, partial [bacterium]